jgi:hypothetical protein
MSARSRQIRWFGGLYLASIAVLVLVTLMLRLVIRLVAR